MSSFTGETQDSLADVRYAAGELCAAPICGQKSDGAVGTADDRVRPDIIATRVLVFDVQTAPLRWAQITAGANLNVMMAGSAAQKFSITQMFESCCQS